MALATDTAAGGIQPETTSNWEGAASRYASALSALHEGGTADWLRRAQACDAAMWRLFEAPAPDLDAVARKLEIAFAPETDLEGMLDANAARALILQDVRRLAGA